MLSCPAFKNVNAFKMMASSRLRVSYCCVRDVRRIFALHWKSFTDSCVQIVKLWTVYVYFNYIELRVFK